MDKPLLLDLFSGAGGCARGYQLAGFCVVGADLEAQPHYIGDEFYQDNALIVLDILLRGEAWHGHYLDEFSVIHASPVCKAYTYCNRPNLQSLLTKDDYPRLISDVRTRLQQTRMPYIIENVVGAKHEMHASLMLCASMFGLPMQRHRLFEIGNTDIFIPPPAPCDHRNATISVVGHSVWDSSKVGTPRKNGRRRADSVPAEIGRAAMGIDWMTKAEMAQAIPPAYTRYIGEHLMRFVEESHERKTEGQQERSA